MGRNKFPRAMVFWHLPRPNIQKTDIWHQQSFAKRSFQTTHSWTCSYSTNIALPVLTAKSKSIRCKGDCALGVLTKKAFPVIHTLWLWQQFVSFYSLRWLHSEFFFYIFFALAHKPFWSILHPNTFKNHPQLKLQKIQWKAKVSQTREWMAAARKMTVIC